MELRFKIKDIPDAGAPFSVRRPVPQTLLSEVLEGTDGDVSASHAELEMDFTRDHDEVIGRGRVRGVFVLPCARCVEPASVPIDARLDLILSREGAPARDDEVSDEDDVDPIDAPDTFTHDGKTVSLEEPLRELLIAELPISPLCSEGCLGLCPTCGLNRNTPEGRACGHAIGVEDPPTTSRQSLAALASIKLPS